MEYIIAAVTVTFCWYFRSVLVYIIIAAVVSLYLVEPYGDLRGFERGGLEIPGDIGDDAGEYRDDLCDNPKEYHQNQEERDYR